MMQLTANITCNPKIPPIFVSCNQIARKPIYRLPKLAHAYCQKERPLSILIISRLLEARYKGMEHIQLSQDSLGLPVKNDNSLRLS